jgi:hypothetical protein
VSLGKQFLTLCRALPLGHYLFFGTSVDSRPKTQRQMTEDLTPSFRCGILFFCKSSSRTNTDVLKITCELKNIGCNMSWNNIY